MTVCLLVYLSVEVPNPASNYEVTLSCKRNHLLNFQRSLLSWGNDMYFGYYKSVTRQGFTIRAGHIWNFSWRCLLRVRLCKLKIGENQVFDYNNSNIPLFHFPFAFRNTGFNEVLIKKEGRCHCENIKGKPTTCQRVKFDRKKNVT